MKLLLIRHAIAEEREDFARTGKDDRLRPLTDEGRKKMKQAARGLRRLAPRSTCWRPARSPGPPQTGAIVDSVYGGLQEVEIDELSPGATPADFLRWLRSRRRECIAAVGHEPSISLIFSWLLTGAERRIFSFRKGGACLLDFPGEVGAGTATLVWALTPGPAPGPRGLRCADLRPSSSGLLSRPPEEGARLLALSFLDQAAAARPRLATPRTPRRSTTSASACAGCAAASRPTAASRPAGPEKARTPAPPARRLDRPGPRHRGPDRMAARPEPAPLLAAPGGPRLAARPPRGAQARRLRELQDEVAGEFDSLEAELRAPALRLPTEVRLDARKARPDLRRGDRGDPPRPGGGSRGAPGPRMSGPGDEEEAHGARIRAKRLRYLLEPCSARSPEPPRSSSGSRPSRTSSATSTTPTSWKPSSPRRSRSPPPSGRAKILELSLSDAPDENLLRAERRRARESGLIALARLNRARRDRLFATLEAEWLEGKAGDFLREVEGLGEEMVERRERQKGT